MVNRVVIEGNLVLDGEERMTKDSTAVYTNRIASNSYDKTTKKQVADYFNIVAFGTNADYLYTYARKGDRIICDGRIKNNDYTDSFGNKHYSDEIVIDNVTLLDRKEKKSEGETSRSDDSTSNDNDSLFDNEEDLPF